MFELPLFRKTLFVLCVVWFLDFIAQKFYLYWDFWWYDSLVHFLAGVCVAMGFILVTHWWTGVFPTFRKIFTISITSSIIIGVLWEIFEVYFELTSLSDGVRFWSDTISDLLIDTLGGLLGGLYSWRVYKRTQLK